MAGNPIDYGQTFVWNGKTFVQVMDKRHCNICYFWKNGSCKADDNVPACSQAPIAFIEIKLKEGGKK